MIYYHCLAPVQQSSLVQVSLKLESAIHMTKEEANIRTILQCVYVSINRSIQIYLTFTLTYKFNILKQNRNGVNWVSPKNLKASARDMDPAKK